MGTWYLDSHEWARADGAEVVVGLSAYAAGEVGDVIHVQLPAVGTAVKRGGHLADIESVKSVNEIYAPVDGTVTAVNAALAEQPELVNQDPGGKGWFLRIKPSAAQPFAGLKDEATYLAQVGH